MKVLVTGVGFIGGCLTRKLLDIGHEVTVVASGGEVVDSRAKVTYCGLNGFDWSALKDQDIVYHQLANNDTLCVDEEEMFRINYDHSLLLMRSACAAGVKKVVYASSTAVYGDSPAPYIEGITDEVPLNCYGRSKQLLDNYVLLSANKDFYRYNEAKWSSMDVIGLRYCNVYGPGEEHKGPRMSMIGQMIRQVMSGEQPKLFKWGEQRRDWVYIDDVVKANLLAMKADFTGVLNVGSGQSYTFVEGLAYINEALGTNVEPEYIDCHFEDAYQEYTECCIEKAGRILGYVPDYDLRSGINAYIDRNAR
jgi:ADP-L-glycero-D-manno-heptose 6-epimerase